MSLKIGTNLDYRGHDFLDSRQGLPTSIEYLRDWDYTMYPVPLGFETCLDGEWYIYTDEWTDETGYWKKRGIGGAGGGGDYDEQIAKLMEHCFPLTFSLSSGHSYLKGTTGIKPSLSWSLKREIQNVEIVDTWIKTGSGSEVHQPTNATSWTSLDPITSDTTYTVKVKSVDGVLKSAQSTWGFYLNRYWGAVSDYRDTPVLGSSILQKEKATTWKKEGDGNEAVFDCTGGKYPMYIFPWKYVGDDPESFFNNTFRMIISRITNTNWEWRKDSLRNETQNSVDYYAVVYLKTMQRGSHLSIEFF